MFDDAVWAVNSAVECYPHTVEVRGSNPLPPTITAERFPPWSFYLKIEALSMKPISFTRRQFISKSGKAGIALATVWSTPALTAGSAPVSLPDNASPSGEAARLRDLFLNPPHSARSMTRWWWFGGAATPQEITRGPAGGWQAFVA